MYRTCNRQHVLTPFVHTYKVLILCSMHAGVLPASWGSVDAFPELTSLTIGNTNITGSFSSQTWQILAVFDLMCLHVILSSAAVCAVAMRLLVPGTRKPNLSA